MQDYTASCRAGISGYPPFVGRDEEDVGELEIALVVHRLPHALRRLLCVHAGDVKHGDRCRQCAGASQTMDQLHEHILKWCRHCLISRAMIGSYTMSRPQVLSCAPRWNERSLNSLPAVCSSSDCVSSLALLML